MVRGFLTVVIIIGVFVFPRHMEGQENSDLQILFVSQRSGTDQIYIMNIDGTDVQPLTTFYSHGRFNMQPAYSPSVNRILFTSQQDLGYYPQITTMNTDGLDVITLTNDYITKGLGSWSPAGDRITFSSNASDSVDIYIINSDGSNLVRLTTDYAVDDSPDWSPDGSKIVFDSNRDNNPNRASEIYVMNIDGSNQMRLTVNDGNDTMPDWSPDGSQIVFSSQREGDNRDIYVMDADGSNPVQLTSNSGNNYDPAWSPDGTMIAFSSNRDDNFEIYVMNADGSNQHRITNDSDYDGSPEWLLAPTAACDTTIPVADTTTLISAITSANGVGTPQTLCLTNSSYTLDTVPSITGDITILGNGATIEFASGGFTVAEEGELTLHDVNVILR